MSRTWRKSALLAVAAAALAGAVTAGSSQAPAGSRLIAIFVVDGLRPDSINTADTPTIARLRTEGTEYVNSHSVFPTVTRVNTTVLATGAYPSQNGIVGNSMFVEGVNARAPFDNGDHTQLLKLEEISGRVVTTETLGEMLQRNGRRLVTVSSGSNGNGFLLNPNARHGAGVAIHGLFDRGAIAAYPKDISDAILQRFGAPAPGADEVGLMTWTDTVLRDYVLPELRPDVVIDWMGPLDAAQHANGAGAPQSKEALAKIDGSIAQTIAKIDALGLMDRADIVITSDHGFAHHTTGVNVIDALIAGGLKKDRESTDVIVASQSESLLFYLPAHEPERIEKVVQFLQQQPWIDVLFTRGGRDGQGSAPGTFSLDLIDASHPSRGADIVASLTWTSQPNPYGVPGTHTIDSATTGPLQGAASGHGGLNPWVVHNTFVAWGADFKTRTRVEAPVSLADVTPTLLSMFRIDAGAGGGGRGRILRELMKDGPPAASVKTIKRVVTTSAGSYRASVKISSVEGRDYIDSGSREP